MHDQYLMMVGVVVFVAIIVLAGALVMLPEDVEAVEELVFVTEELDAPSPAVGCALPLFDDEHIISP